MDALFILKQARSEITEMIVPVLLPPHSGNRLEPALCLSRIVRELVYESIPSTICVRIPFMGQVICSGGIKAAADPSMALDAAILKSRFIGGAS
ncbi:hypothetical protein CEXT_493321 [Caerostris extrusa]|uniref:Uncharacterized protein n=1 Tax=Caerostris extrusa TaxID=172846 RepID=A0AAV4XT48_CAEEX|nr:hypothetical protein CEXT_493321 [Caerostris extrusa]